MFPKTVTVLYSFELMSARLPFEEPPCTYNTLDCTYERGEF